MPLPVETQLEVFRRGTVDLIDEKELAGKLASGRPLVAKVGFDPTAPDLHLGHTVLMRKMRQLQDLGHTVIFLVGDFTARIGDPTGRTKTRPPLSAEEIARNAETYKAQAFKVLDPARTILRANSEWLTPLDGAALVRLAAQYTVARMLERDDFARRLREQRPISIHEFLYPLFQAYDSVALRCDLELGGQDQLFNLVVGREVMKGYGLPPQCILTVPVLEGIDAREEGGRVVGDKMSKSLGNTVALEDPPDEMFGKLMSICDLLMWRYYELLSGLDVAAIRALRDDVAQGRVHPRDAKARLATELVGRFHDPASAAAAAESLDYGASRTIAYMKLEWDSQPGVAAKRRHAPVTTTRQPSVASPTNADVPWPTVSAVAEVGQRTRMLTGFASKQGGNGSRMTAGHPVGSASATSTSA